jgi:hypothetical protein
MIRALTTLVGLAAAAAILYFVTDVGDSGGSWWPKALVWAAAGLVLGILYQGGGRRGPGLRMNLPMLILAFLPWSILTAALVAIEANNPVWLADRGRDILPDGWIGRWEFSLPAFAFGAGLLLAFSLLEPRIGMREPPPADSVTAPVEPYTPYVPPEPAAYAPVTAVQPATRDTVVAERPDGAETVVDEAPDTAQTVVTREPSAVDEPPTVEERSENRLLSDGSAENPENPVRVIHPERETHSDG